MPGRKAPRAWRPLLRTLLVAVLAATAAGCGSSAPPGPDSDAVVDTVPVTVISDTGQRIEIMGGGALIGPLVVWALDRFTGAGLEEPQIPRIQFEPDDPACFGVTGLFRENEEGRSVVICLDEDRICDYPDAPEGFRATARSCMLHEFAHAWLRDNLDDATREAFLAVSPPELWYEKGGEWIDQGVEHAAEIIMWGLIDERTPLGRIDDPPCADLAARFRLLTAVDPLIPCEEEP